MRHYIAMSGMRGYLPDYCHAHHTLEEAVEDLANLFGLDEQDYADLRDGRFLDLAKGSGVEYCEIEECDCKTPEIHDDDE